MKVLTSRLASITILATLAGCGPDPVGPSAPDAETIAKLTITAQPRDPTLSVVPGYAALGIASPRDAFLYVPAGYDPAVAAPLVVLLHGAGGTKSQWATSDVETVAATRGLVVLAIDSRYATWDVVTIGRYDPDVAFLNDALNFVFDRVRVDSLRISIGGFSDGAAEALGIGIANAKLFRRIIAFSPSRMVIPFSRGQPDVFVSHGLQDSVIPFSNSETQIVPRLRANGMNVNFHAFAGDHEVIPEVLSTAFTWLFTP